MAFKLRQPCRTKSQSPQVSCRMKEIEMCSGCRHRDLAGHAIAGFEQRPIEALPVERDEDREFRESFPQCKQQRALLAVLPHEQLFNLKSATFPPCQAHEKRICAAPTRKAGGLCVEKKPFAGVGYLVCRFWQ